MDITLPEVLVNINLIGVSSPCRNLYSLWFVCSRARPVSIIKERKDSLINQVKERKGEVNLPRVRICVATYNIAKFSTFFFFLRMVLRSQLVDLWKFRVQHLRQYYCFHGHKPKQKSSPAISRHVWFIPLILTLWWLLIAVIFLYTLKMEHLLSTGINYSFSY